MSALPPKADIGTQSGNVRFVPKADIMQCSKMLPLFNHLIDARQERFWDSEADRLGGREIDDEIKFVGCSIGISPGFDIAERDRHVRSNIQSLLIRFRIRGRSP